MRTLALLSIVVIAACTETSQPLGPAPGAGQGSGSATDPGPRSGLPEDAAVRDLSGTEREALCNWWAETLGGVGRMQSCSECEGDACTDWDVAVSTLHDCLDWMSTLQCGATVNQAENCAFAQQPDLCASPAACDPFTGC